MRLFRRSLRFSDGFEDRFGKKECEKCRPAEIFEPAPLLFATGAAATRSTRFGHRENRSAPGRRLLSSPPESALPVLHPPCRPDARCKTASAHYALPRRYPG